MRFYSYRSKTTQSKGRCLLNPQFQKGLIFTKRTIKKQFWVSPQEDTQLKQKAHKTELNEATLLRMLIRDLNHFITAVEEEFLAPEKVGGENDRN